VGEGFLLPRGADLGEGGAQQLAHTLAGGAGKGADRLDRPAGRLGQRRPLLGDRLGIAARRIC
jgi:hypothetical protein